MCTFNSLKIWADSYSTKEMRHLHGESALTFILQQLDELDEDGIHKFSIPIPICGTFDAIDGFEILMKVSEEFSSGLPNLACRVEMESSQIQVDERPLLSGIPTQTGRHRDTIVSSIPRYTLYLENL